MDTIIKCIDSSPSFIIPRMCAAQCGLSTGTPLSIYVNDSFIVLDQMKTIDKKLLVGIDRTARERRAGKSDRFVVRDVWDVSGINRVLILMHSISTVKINIHIIHI